MSTETTSGEGLKQFCSAEDGKYQFTTPFVCGGWRYACDGRIGIRTPATGEADSEGNFPTDLDTAFTPPPVGNDQPWPTGEIVRRDGDCCFCAGRGRTHTVRCALCDGEGETYCRHCGHTGDCNDCNGQGWTGGKWCVECEGKGDGANLPRYRQVGELKVSAQYDRLIRSLDGLRWSGNVDQRVHFKFDGGEGVVMSLLID